MSGPFASPRRRFPSSKFHPPRGVAHPLPRERLFDELDGGAGRMLTLVTAAPGAGKTTILADWLGARTDRRSAWLTCDVGDADPLRFVGGVVESLRLALGDRRLGESTLQLLDVDGEMSMDAAAALADDVERSCDRVVLVIDDFDDVGSGDTIHALALLLDCRPVGLQVVVASRTAPPLRLHRLRVQEQLLELDDGDLAFSLDETAAFFAEFGLHLPDAEVAQAQQRTEGWPVGLQMAALSMQASPDQASLVGKGDVHSHTIAQYFLEEVLYRQPASVAEFMLATSVLDELTVASCAALVGDRARELLEHVHDAHLFVTLLDEETGTFRYHHLVREVLRRELAAGDPEKAARLHKAAARHLLQTGRAAAAARHLLEAGDAAAAFELLGDALVRDVLTNPTVGSALDLDEFRPHVYAGVPEMLVPLAAELLWRGAFERGVRAVKLARECDVDPVRDPRLAVQMALVNTLHCTFVGEFDDAVRHRDAARAFESRAEGVEDWIVTLDTLAMYCHTYLGRYAEARALAAALIERRVSVPLSEVLCPGVLTQVALLEGELDEATALTARTLEAAVRLRFDHHFFVFHTLRTQGQLALERRELAAAAAPIELALGMVNGARPAFNFLAQLDRARVWAASGQREAALASLPAARAALKSTKSTLLAEADELEARLRLALGDPNGARSAARGLPAARRAVFDAVFALAADDAELAERALDRTDAAPWPRTVRADIEHQLLRAAVGLAKEAAHDSTAVRAARQALEAARDAGFLHLVLETAPQIVDHLIANPDQYPNVDQLSGFMSARLEALALDGTRRPRLVVDELTESELRVVAKLADGLSYAEIAGELFVSLNTVKTHLRHAYMKLGVSTRLSAIARASALGLL